MTQAYAGMVMVVFYTAIQRKGSARLRVLATGLKTGEEKVRTTLTVLPQLAKTQQRVENVQTIDILFVSSKSSSFLPAI